MPQAMKNNARVMAAGGRVLEPDTRHWPCCPCCYCVRVEGDCGPYCAGFTINGVTTNTDCDCLFLSNGVSYAHSMTSSSIDGVTGTVRPPDLSPTSCCKSVTLGWLNSDDESPVHVLLACGVAVPPPYFNLLIVRPLVQLTVRIWRACRNAELGWAATAYVSYAWPGRELPDGEGPLRSYRFEALVFAGFKPDEAGSEGDCDAPVTIDNAITEEDVGCVTNPCDPFDTAGTNPSIIDDFLPGVSKNCADLRYCAVKGWGGSITVVPGSCI